MPEIRCPMCGKSNPDEVEVCQFCQARLKPLVFSPPVQDEGPARDSADQDREQGAQGEPAALPDWLHELRNEEETEEDASGREAEAKDANFEFGEGEEQDDQLAWLQRIQLNPSEEEQPHESPSSSWEEEFQSPFIDAEQPEEAESPAWLSWRPEEPDASASLEEVPGAIVDQSAEAEQAKAEEEPAEISGWFTEAADDRTPAETSEPAPEWQMDLDEEAQEQEFEEQFSSDLPDWSPGEPLDQEEFTSPEVEPGLEQADLPDWLEAMRPVEDAAPSLPFREESSERMEKAGPLAGLRGILSAEPEIARLQTPPTYSLKLRVSAAQRAHADLLKSILEAEGEVRPIPRRPVISPQHLLRWGIALVLILPVLWSILTADQSIVEPSFLEETGEVSRLIEGLPAEARTLLVFDYDPGLSSELEAAATPVIDHLMLRGSYLALVSTNPTGPILAERFLSGILASHAYARNVQYANLGYLAGGPSGMLSLLANPQRTLPFTLDGVIAWGSVEGQALPPLAGIAALSDFELVVILVDDPQTARAWIEQLQVGRTMGDFQTPLVMVTSAQAEPLIRPYFETNPRQVQGMVAGLRGGMAYSRLTGRESVAGLHWRPFAVGLSVAGLIVALGLILNIASTVLSNPLAQRESAKVEESR